MDTENQTNTPSALNQQAGRARTDAARDIYYKKTITISKTYNTLAVTVIILTIATTTILLLKMSGLYHVGGAASAAAGVMNIMYLSYLLPILVAGVVLFLFLFSNARKSRRKATDILAGKEIIPDLTSLTTSMTKTRNRRYINYAAIGGVGVVVLLKLLNVI